MLQPLWERMGVSLGVRRAEAGSSVPIPWCPVTVTAPARGGDEVCSAAPPSGTGTGPSPSLVAWNVGYLSTWDSRAIFCAPESPQQKLPGWGGPSPHRLGFVPSAGLARLVWRPRCCRWSVDKAPRFSLGDLGAPVAPLGSGLLEFQPGKGMDTPSSPPGTYGPGPQMEGHSDDGGLPFCEGRDTRQ